MPKKKIQIDDEWKISDKFYKRQDSSNGLDGRCKKCKDEVSQLRWKERYYQRNYGKSYKIKKEILYMQEYKCAICGNSLEEYSALNHDHKTGFIRGCLCRNCNLGLGNFRDNTDYLYNAINYLVNNLSCNKDVI